MKILIIERTIEQGGGSTVSIQAATELLKRGHEVKIATIFVNLKNLPKTAYEISYLTPPKVVAKICQKNKLLLFLFGPVFLFFTVLRASKEVDVINPASVPTHWIGAVCRLFNKKPVVWSCYEPYIDISFKELVRVGIISYLANLLPKTPLDRILVRKINTILTLDEKNRERVKKLYNCSSTVNHPGVDCNFYQKNSLTKKTTQKFKSKFNLLVVGEFTPMKNQFVVIDSLAKIRERIRNANLLIVGKGPLEKFLKNRVKTLNLEKTVKFFGQVSEEKKRELYHLCNLNLFPAVGQTWGLTPFEALCAKKLSIVSNDCGAAEVLGKEKIGIIAKPTASDFAEKILDYYLHPEKYQEMTTRGYNFVRRELTWENYALNLEREMKKVLNKKE